MARLVLAISLLCLAPLASTADTPPADALVGEIPFHPQSPPSRVMVDLAPEGQKPFVLMLDTGASASVMSPRVARALGVSIRKLKDAAYRKATRLGRDLQFWVDSSFSDVGSTSMFEFGLLGGDFMDDYVLEIDYPGRMVRFYDPRKYSVPEETTAEDEAVVPFKRNGTRILADMEIEGTTLLALLDTGGPAVDLDGRSAKRVGIDWTDLPEMTTYTTKGPVKTHTYVAKSVRFGGLEFRDQPIAISPQGFYNAGGPTDSILGYDVLKRFVMRIDYHNKRIWLKDGGKLPVSYWGRVDAPDDTFAGRVVDQPTAEDVTENDTRIAKEWHDGLSKRRYEDTGGGRFAVVEDYRVRAGPETGEVWYTHEQMLARKKQTR